MYVLIDIAVLLKMIMGCCFEIFMSNFFSLDQDLLQYLSADEFRRLIKNCRLRNKFSIALLTWVIRDVFALDNHSGEHQITFM